MTSRMTSSNKARPVTMVQRSSTYVMSSRNGIDVLAGGLAEPTGMTLDEIDLLGMSFPIKTLFELQREYFTPEIARRDADMLTGLSEVGFHTNQIGIHELFLTRGGGYYIDVGTSARIADGSIGVRSGVEIERLTEKGVVYTDGASQDADAVVFATGYTTMHDVARDLLGDEIADRCGPVWNLDEEGEQRSVWRRTGQEGLWFMAGNLMQARQYSRFLALQIKAIEEGLIPR